MADACTSPVAIQRGNRGGRLLIVGTESAAATGLDGYVDDGLYPSNFHPHFQLPWTRAQLIFHGFRPPTADRAPFRFVDLGCGDGFGLIVMAAAHPEGTFLGFDALEGHVARGNALIARLGINNVRLECATFDALSERAAGDVDYVMAQGVLAWISPAARAALWRAAAGLLKPGGVFSVGYNAHPGWTWVLPLQRLLRARAATLDGEPAERFDQAYAQARASGLVQQSVLDWMDGWRARLPRDYFAHEYLNAYWEPQWCTDVWRDAAAVGLDFLVDATTLCLRDDFALKAAWREQLRTIESPAERALATDLRVDRWYRVDVFGRPPIRRLKPAAVRAQRLATHWGTGGSTERESFECSTPAGTLRFDNIAARAILSCLQDGPRPLSDVPDLAPVDLLETIDALWMADVVRPLASFAELPFGAATNRAVFASATEGEPMNGVVGRHGAIPVRSDMVSSGLPEAVRRRLAIVGDEAG